MMLAWTSLGNAEPWSYSRTHMNEHAQDCLMPLPSKLAK